MGICYLAAHIDCSHSEGSPLHIIVGHEDSKAAEVGTKIIGLSRSGYESLGQCLLGLVQPCPERVGAKGRGTGETSLGVRLRPLGRKQRVKVQTFLHLLSFAASICLPCSSQASNCMRGQPFTTNDVDSSCVVYKIVFQILSKKF